MPFCPTSAVIAGRPRSALTADVLPPNLRDAVLARAAPLEPAARSLLDAVSAKLTSAGLATLNAAVAGNSGIDPGQVARNWLRDNGFDHSMTP